MFRHGAFYSAYNSGFNILESVNFILPTWLSHLNHYVPCFCQSEKQETLKQFTTMKESMYAAMLKMDNSNASLLEIS